jgi:hypothetical protein
MSLSIVVPEYEQRSFEPRRSQRAGPSFTSSRAAASPDANNEVHWHDVAGYLFTLPASTEAIMGLRAPAAGETRELSCAVCLEDFEAADELRRMPCSHSFHRRCIFRWLRISRLCPWCRFPLPSVDEQRVLNEQAARAHAGS